MSGRQIIDPAALAKLTPDQIAEATREGRLDALLGGANLRRGKQLSPAKLVELLKNLTPEEYAAAVEAGLLADEREATPSDEADQGARHGTPGGTVRGERARLQTLSPAEIAAELKAGKLDALLRGELAP